MNNGLFINGNTGETVERELTAQEVEGFQRSTEEIKAEETEKVNVARRGAFQIEADPLFFGWQRGENSEQAWLDKVAEIRDRHPYPS